MDYYDLILKGYANTSNRKHFDRYLFRAFKEAESLHFSAEEFYDGCYEVIESLKRSLDTKVMSYKHKYEKKLSMLEKLDELPPNLKTVYIKNNSLKNAEFYLNQIDNAAKNHGWEQHLIENKFLKINYTLIEALSEYIIKAQNLSNVSSNTKLKKSKSDPTYIQTALICAYNNIQIEKHEENPDILKKHKLNSWVKLYIEYKKVQRRVDRQAKPSSYTKTTLKNKIDLFEKISPSINEEFRHKIEEDITLLKSFMEKDFY